MDAEWLGMPEDIETRTVNKRREKNKSYPQAPHWNILICKLKKDKHGYLNLVAGEHGNN